MKGFQNVPVYLTGEGIKRLSVGVENGRIAYIGEDASRIDAPIAVPEGCTVFPGFLDEHIHGAGGADAMDGTTASLATIADRLAAEGVTAFLATTMTEREEKIVSALQNIGAYMAADRHEGARVLGAHLEGPFIAEKFCGAQDPAFIRKPSVKLFEKFQRAANGNVRMVTLAPEEDAEGLVSFLAGKGITVSAGHSNAPYACVEAAAGKGLSCITHTYNAQRPLHHRDLGVSGAALAIDKLYAECICDTIHVSVPAIGLLYRNKPEGKFILITDAMRAKGLGDGESELGGQKVIVQNGEARLENGALAGSVLQMNRAIENLVNKCGVPPENAVDCATIHPARNLGLDKDRGSITLGKVADFAVMDKEFNVILTVRDGEIIYRK